MSRIFFPVISTPIATSLLLVSSSAVGSSILMHSGAATAQITGQPTIGLPQLNQPTQPTTQPDLAPNVGLPPASSVSTANYVLGVGDQIWRRSSRS